MHPRISELFEHLDRGRAVLETAVSSVPASGRPIQPGPDRWSVAQVVEHLAIVEQRIARLIAIRIADAKAKGLAPETQTSSILATFDSNRAVDRTTRFVNPNAIPTGTVDVEGGLAALDAARRELKAAALTGDGFDLSGTTAPHPVFGQLSMYEWIAFAGSHMERHADQIREVGATLSAAGPS